MKLFPISLINTNGQPNWKFIGGILALLALLTLGITIGTEAVMPK